MSATGLTQDRRRHDAQLGRRGQVAVIFAGAMLLFVLLAAAVIDLSWYWTNNLRMQRAADAASLAGVVFLPGDTANAYTAARAEAAKNGYTHGAGGVVVTPLQDPSNERRLKVTITGPVNTYFARAVGITSWPARRDAKADFVLPVPMGSPENYYGVGYLIEPVTTTTTTTTAGSGSSSSQHPGNAPGAPGWTASAGNLVSAVADASGSGTHVLTTTAGGTQQYGNFNLSSGLAANQTLTAVTGLQVTLNDVRISAACGGGSVARVRVHLSWDGGLNWTTATTETPNLGTNATSGDYVLGSTSSMAAWPKSAGSWNQPSDLANGNLIVRLTAVKGAGCAGTVQVIVDELIVRAWYNYNTVTTTTTTTLQQNNVVGPGGQALTPQKFWGAMQSQGAPSIQGDAYMTKYETRKSTLNGLNSTSPDANYAWQDYYNYAVEIPAGASNGAIYVYDAGFCDATTSAGTGENWTVGGANGNGTRQPVSAYFEVYDTQETLLNTQDDTFISGSGTNYRRLSYQDHQIYGLLGQSPTSGIGDCSSQSWHLGWTQIASGLPGGTYRIHSFSTDPTALTDQDDSTGLNAFAFYANASGGTPRIYGLGAMEAYVRLPGGQASEFYLAQIDAVHAGKTMIINLWDPGDTGALSASLEILQPTGSGFTPTTFDYQGTVGTTAGAASACGGLSGTGVSAVTTNTGGSSRFNGCWLTIEIALPTTYSAPTDPVSGEDGWWKIRYTMGGSTSSFSTDLTTWQVNIRGNPVHLVLP